VCPSPIPTQYLLSTSHTLTYNKKLIFIHFSNKEKEKELMEKNLHESFLSSKIKESIELNKVKLYQLQKVQVGF